MMDLKAKERAKERQRKANQKKEAEVRKQVVPMREDGTMATRQPIGTNLGNRQRMQEFKNKLLKEENGNRILQKLLDVALDDDHPGQMSAIKICMDRMLPLGMFDEAKSKSDRPSIQINITGIGESVSVGETIDGEVIDE